MSEPTLPDGRRHPPGVPGSWSHPASKPAAPATGRVVFAAVPVVADPRANGVPGAPAAIDRETTMAFRRHLRSWGPGVADARDNLGLFPDPEPAAHRMRSFHEVGGMPQ